MPWGTVLDFMEINSFIYKGKEYQIDEVSELDAEAGKWCIRIITKDNKQFKAKYNESIFKWEISESTN